VHCYAAFVGDHFLFYYVIISCSSLAATFRLLVPHNENKLYIFMLFYYEGYSDSAFLFQQPAMSFSILPLLKLSSLRLFSEIPYTILKNCEGGHNFLMLYSSLFHGGGHEQDGEVSHCAPSQQLPAKLSLLSLRFAWHVAHRTSALDGRFPLLSSSGNIHIFSLLTCWTTCWLLTFLGRIAGTEDDAHYFTWLVF